MHCLHPKPKGLSCEGTCLKYNKKAISSPNNLSTLGRWFLTSCMDINFDNQVVSCF